MKSKLNLFFLLALVIVLGACSGGGLRKDGSSVLNKDVASRVYVAPGDKDEFYAFFSGGFSGQVSVYGLPSGRMFRRIPVFSVDAEKGWGFSEETKPMLQTSFGFMPWDDAHHAELSQTDGTPDGRWLFINGNNTPRVARIGLDNFETAEIIEIPNSAGNHSSPFITENTEYLVAGTRFSVPIPQADVPIKTYKENFKGALSFISVEEETGHMDLAFQIFVPGFDYDLAHAGKGKSHGWMFFSTYNTEQEATLKEVTASRNDKDFIAAVNWKKAEEYLEQGKFETHEVEYYTNRMDESTQTASSTLNKTVKVIRPEDCPGIIYFLPTPKSPHGVDVDPSGEYIIGNGKLSADLSVHSFTKMLKAIENEEFEEQIEGIKSPEAIRIP